MTIRDMVHKDIEIEDELIIKLLNCKEVQRLRKIKQLGLTYKVFMCSEHTRYSHSLGVYFLANKCIRKLKQTSNFEINDLEIQAFLIACLLHDLGHGPMSHTAEMFFGYKHESFSVKIINDKNTSVNKIINEYNPKLLDHVCKFILKTHSNKVLTQLLSSSIDVDRMDYLMRDSLTTGVEYGKIEVDRIISCMDVIDSKLVYNEKAIKLLEDLIFSRYQMFSLIYLNKNTMVYEKIISEILCRVKTLIRTNYNFKTDLKLLLPFFKIENISIDEYLKMNDIVFMYILEQLQYEDDEVLKMYCKCFDLTTRIFREKRDNTFELKVKALTKTNLYDESIYIVRKSGRIVKLEDVSELIKFVKNDLTIKIGAQSVYVEKQ